MRLCVDCGGAHNLPWNSSAYTIVVIEWRNYLEDPTIPLTINKEPSNKNGLSSTTVV